MKAFPNHGMTNRNGQNIEWVHAEGMDLRDYFAAKAMHGTLPYTANESHYEQIAKNAYALADAMMKAREQ